MADSQAKTSYKYKDFIEKSFAALNNWDFETFLSPADFAANFVKHLYPQSMEVQPQTREQWHEDLTTGFVGQNYVQWKATIQQYWEDEQKRSAIAWCSEEGVLVDGERYQMDYMMRYHFDETGKLAELFEYTDSALQKGIYERWLKRQEGRDKAKSGDTNNTRND